METQQLAAEFYDYRKRLRNGESGEHMQLELRRLAARAFSLHEELNRPGVHSEVLLENRRCQPSNPLFYEHVHAIEELLNYLGEHDLIAPR